MTTMIKETVKFNIVMDQLKNYVSTENNNPALNLVYFDGVNFMAVNPHTMLLVSKDVISDIPEGLTANSFYNTYTNEIVKDALKFPDISRYTTLDVNLNIRLNGSMNELNMVYNSDETELKGIEEDQLIQFIAQDDYLEYREMYKKEIIKNYIMRHRWVIASDDNEYKINVRRKYLGYALDTINTLANSNNDIEFRIRGNKQPLIIKQDNVITLLIMPVVTY